MKNGIIFFSISWRHQPVYGFWTLYKKILIRTAHRFLPLGILMSRCTSSATPSTVLQNWRWCCSYPLGVFLESSILCRYLVICCYTSTFLEKMMDQFAGTRCKNDWWQCLLILFSSILVSLIAGGRRTVNSYLLFIYSYSMCVLPSAFILNACSAIS